MPPAPKKSSAPSRAALNLRDLWKYRELVYFLTWRDIKVRYKQTVLGASWAILQPVLTDGGVQHLLRRAAAQGFRRRDCPTRCSTYTALLPWGLFSKALTDAGRSLVPTAA
jgi:lipopolysaccharide transport system permease protein